MWSSGVTLLSGSNFGRSFSRCFGNGWCVSGTAWHFVANQCLLVAMVARKLKLGLGYGGLVSGGLRGPEPLASAQGGCKKWNPLQGNQEISKIWDLLGFQREQWMISVVLSMR